MSLISGARSRPRAESRTSSPCRASAIACGVGSSEWPVGAAPHTSMRSLEARLLAAVALLAVAAVLGVAIAARRGARHEFNTYQALERRASRDDVGQVLHELVVA